MDNVYPYDLFLSLIGLERDRSLLESSGNIRHSVVTTDKDEGAMRALHLNVRHDADNPHRFSIQGFYMLHGSSEEGKSHKIIDISTCDKDGMVALESVEVMGRPIDLDKNNSFAVNESVSALVNAIAYEHNWINFIELFEQHGLAPSAFGRAALPGLYADGSVKSLPAHNKESDVEYKPVFPAFLLPSIIGCGPEHYSGIKQSTRSLPFTDHETQETLLLRHGYKEDQNPLDIEVVCELVSHSPEGLKTLPLYRVKTRPEKVGGSEESQARITQLEFYHPNSPEGEPERVDLSNPREVAIACKTMRMMNRGIRAGVQDFKNDLLKKPQDRRLFLPTDIMLQSGLTEMMVKKTSAPKRGGRLEVRPLGGQGTRTVFSKRDQSIGGNAYEITYTPPGETEGQTILEDAGTLFHDEFDDVIINLGRYLPHKYNKHHVPERNVTAMVLSHGHKDHYGALGYLARAYEVPPMFMKASTFEKVKRDLDSVKLDAKIKAEVLEKCHIIEPSKDVNISDPTATEDMQVGDLTFTRKTEVVPGENLGQNYYYPQLEIGDITLRLCDIPHSDPGLMIDYVTEAGSYRHTGDYKLDPTYQSHIGPFWPWIKAHQPDMIGADSTGALKDPEERTVTEAEIQRDLVKLMSEHKSERIFTSIIGSNITRFQTLVRTMGETGREHLLVDGKALNDMVKDQDKINDLVDWARREHNVRIVKQSEKGKVTEVLNEIPKSEQVILLTGTQDEPFSSLNRGLRDWLPDGRPSFFKDDVMMMLQGAIPVDNNYSRRIGAAFYAQHVIGMTLILPEIVEQEAGLKIAGSGHPGPADMMDLYRESGHPLVLPVHGSTDQLEANAKHAAACGCETAVLNNGEAMVKEKGKEPVRGTKEVVEVVALKSNAPPDQFWNRSNMSATVVPLKPLDDSAAGTALRRFETAAFGHDSTAIDFEAVEPLALAISNRFNMAITGGFISANYPFGVEKYGADVYKEKRLGSYSAADTETTGTDAVDDFITQFAVVEWALDKKKQNETVLFQQVPEYHTGSPEAYLVTDTPPQETREGLPPVLFADRVNEAIKDAKSRSKDNFYAANPEDQNRRKRVKTLMVWHNAKFDDKFMRKTLGQGLFDRVRPHSTDGVISVDTRNIARVLHAAAPDAINVRRNEETGFLDFTLQALCEENGIPYDVRKAHKHPEYDAERAMKLFWKMEENAPELVAQMIFNADSSTGHLLNDMRGVDTGYGQNTPYPVFSYMSPSAKHEDLKIGCLLGTTGGRFAIVADLSKDVQDLLDKHPHELETILRDYNDDRLEVIDLKENPMVLPAKYYFGQNTGKRKPAKELLDRRAGIVGAHLNYRDPKRGWQNIADRLSVIYSENAALFFARSSQDEPDLHKNLPSRNLPHVTHPHDTSIHVLKMRATSSFNIVTQKLLPKIKDYREAAVAYHESDEADKETARERAISAYRELTSASGFDNSKALQIHITQYDIAPDSLAKGDRESVENYMQYQGLRMLIRADEAMKYLREDPDRMEKYVGRSPKKRKLLDQIEFDLDAQRERFQSGDVRVRKHAHPWWDDKFGNDSHNDDDPNLAA